MNCLKCGRTVAEGELLCPACSGRGHHPAPEATVTAHTYQKAHEPALTDPGAAMERLEKKIGRLRRWMLVFLVACVGLIGFILLQSVAMVKLHTQLKESDSILVEHAANEAQRREELEDTRALLSTVEEDLAKRDMIIAAYEQMTDIPADSLP